MKIRTWLRIADIVLLIPLLLKSAASCAQEPSPYLAKYIKVSAASVLLNHVRVIDGTGAAPMQDQAVLIEGGKITRIGPASAPPAAPPGTAVIDLTGRSLLPGLVGMHNHLYYIAGPEMAAEGGFEPPLLLPQTTFTAPRMYLAAGVTTMRTTGSVEPYTDQNLKREIDLGHLAGPHIDVTGPYLEGPNSEFIQMHALTGPDDARATVDFWASQGVTSFKAYMDITRAELKAAIEEAHKRGLKVTGHLCSITYPEAVELGIDNLEHGFFVNTQLDSGKQPDLCPSSEGHETLAKMLPDGPEAAALFKLLIDHHVAVTSTLPVFESADPAHVRLQNRVLDTMSQPARQDYLYLRNRELARASADRAKLFQREMQLEHAFAMAGGTLLAGPDPTGDGGVLPGFGDQREIELLVEAGFTPLEAIRIGTLNGANYLGRQDRIGSIAVGKNADLIVIKGDPSAKISDIENVEIVFKDGVGWDSAKLFESVKGRYGQY